MKPEAKFLSGEFVLGNGKGIANAKSNDAVAKRVGPEATWLQLIGFMPM